MWPYYGYGITGYDGHSFTNLFADQQLYVRGIVTDRDMNMWAVAGMGIFMVSRNGELRWCGADDGLPVNCDGIKIALAPDGYPVAVVRDRMTEELLLCGYDGQSWWTIPFPFDWIDEDGEDMYELIRCMAVDPRGHAWFGTIYGALEFDGSTTTLFSRENSGLAGDNVYKMKLDSLGRVWFVCCAPMAGYGGLCFHDGQSFGTMPGLDYFDATGLAITFDGTLAVGRTEGLCIVEPRGLQTTHRTECPDFGYPGGDLAWGPDGTMFMPDSGKGLWGYSDGMWNLMTSEDGLPTDSTTCVDFDSQGVGWIGSNAGVTRWEGAAFTTFTVDEGLATTSVTRLAVDAFDQPWAIGGGDKKVDGQWVLDFRLSHYDGAAWHDHSDDPGVPGVPLNIATDTRGWVWIGEMGMGGGLLSSYDGQSWHRWGMDDGFFDMDMGHYWVHCDSRGNVYTSGVITVGDGYECRLAVFDGSSWTLYPFDDIVTDGTLDAVGRAWLCAGSGYSSDGLRVRDNTGQTQRLNVQNGGVADNIWGAMACSPEGDIIGRNIAGLECHYLNPNVVTIANAESFAAGDALTLKYWAENPGGADRELDLYVLITLPTGDSVYLPTLWYEPVPYQTITIPKETTLNPVEFLTLDLPDDLPTGDYTITPWFCDHGSTEQTG